MKKAFKFYVLAWAIFLVIFNLLCFITPSELFGTAKIDATFWVSYAFITIAFLGNLACAYIAFKKDTLTKVFYNLPLITVSYWGLILMLIVGLAAMLIPFVPNWVGAIVGIAVLAFTTISVIQTKGAAEAVENIDEKNKARTSFIKNLIVETENILGHARGKEIKAECEKVYEAVRYSDPVSNEALSIVEAKITVKVDELASAVEADDAEKVKKIAGEIVMLVGDRNQKCKGLK